MSSSRFPVLPAVLLLGVFQLSTGAARVSGQTATALADTVDAIFAEYAGQAIPGCSVGLSQEKEITLARAYGMADLEHDAANTPETRFESGSVAKQFTAAATVLLALDGEISFDDDIRRYFPELPEWAEDVTIRHLLNHTSGLRDWGVVAGIHGWPRTTRVHDHRHVLDITARQEALNYPPGEYYSYTNTGYNLQAMLVERVTGMSFAEFSRERIFEPLGMARTEWRDDYRRVVEDRAVAYRPVGGGEFMMDMPFEQVHGNGGLLTTVGDLLRFTWNLETGELGGERFIEEMHRQGVLNSGRTISYASGLTVSEYRGIPEVEHGGATAGYRAFLTRFPEQDVAVAVLCNRADANTGRLAYRVADVVLEGMGAPFAEPEPDPEPAEVGAAALERLAGVYRNTRTHEPILLVVADGRLTVEGELPLLPLSETEFRLQGSRVQVVEPAVAGERPALRRIGSDGDTVVFEPVDRFQPTAADLQDFVGAYHSDEAEVTYEVEVREGRPVLVDRYDRALPLAPLYPEAFLTRGGILRFVRDDAGDVAEMRWSQSRVWDLRFEKVR